MVRFLQGRGGARKDLTFVAQYCILTMLGLIQWVFSKVLRGAQKTSEKLEEKT